MRRAAGTGLAGIGALLAVASLAANVLAYALFVALGRALTPVDYGAVAALLNLAVIGTVPGLALQLVAARVVATDGGPRQVPALLRLAVWTGTVLATLVVVLSPGVRVALHLDGTLGVVAVGAALLPTSVTFAVQGILQGGEQFGRLCAVYLAVAVPRFAAGAGAAVAGWGVDGVLVGTLAAAVVGAAVALALLRGRAAPAAAARGTSGPAASWRDVLRSAAATAGLLTLVNVDLLLARAVLPPSASGIYAAGSVFAKAAFWGPQFVSTLLYARMAVQASRRRAVAWAAGVTAALGLCVVAAAAAGGGALVGLLLGERYVNLGRGAALFAALGTVLAVVQVLVYASVAAGDRRLATATWVAVGAVSAAVLLVRPVEPVAVAAIALVGALGVVVAGVVLEQRRQPAGGASARTDVTGLSDPAPAGI